MTPAQALALEPALEEVERFLARTLVSADPTLEAMARQVIGAGGKRMRPRVLLLAYAACGGAKLSAEVIEAAAGVELLHAASLVHDDIIDDAATRRGLPAVQRAHGVGAAIVLGDFLFTKGFALAGRQDDTVVALTARGCERLAEGELRELQATGGGVPDLEAYMAIIDGKTAAMLETCGRVGAHLAGRDDLQDALGAFGRHLGLAFQVSDDLLDLRGDPARTGKPRATDLRNKAPNAAVLLAARNGARARLERFLAAREPTEADVDEALEAVLSSGAVAEAERLAEDHAARAVEALAPVAASSAKAELVRLVRDLPGRST